MQKLDNDNDYICLAAFLVKAPHIVNASVKDSITFTQLCGMWHYLKKPLSIVIFSNLNSCGINVPLWQKRRIYART